MWLKMPSKLQDVYDKCQPHTDLKERTMWLKMPFKLEAIYDKCQPQDFKIVLGDFNAKVGP